MCSSDRKGTMSRAPRGFADRSGFYTDKYKTATDRMTAAMPFKAKLFRVSAGGWLFARVPASRAPKVTHAWGRTPVRASVDGKWWETSVWWDTKRRATMLAVPKRIRGEKDEGDLVEIELRPPRGDRLW
jgi:hypothetical protein